MLVSLKLVEGDSVHDHRYRRILLIKEVDWPCVPVPKNLDMQVALGRDEDGKETGWSITPNAVWFGTDGVITVELEDALHPEVDPFDTFVQYAKNDGFVEYGS